MLIDRYLRDAIEVDVDAICDGTDVAVCGVLQHIEEAGRPFGRQRLRHSAAQPRPPVIIAEIERQTRELALALKVKGLMNVQFAVKGDDVYLIEVNPRASRTVPFVAKAIGRPIAKIAARVMAGETLSDFGPDRARHRLYRGQGPGVPVRALPRDRPGAWTGNEEHRRSHGNR